MDGSVQGEEEGKESRQAQEQLEQAQSPLSQPVQALPQQAQAPPVPQETDPSQALQVSQLSLAHPRHPLFVHLNFTLRVFAIICTLKFTSRVFWLISLVKPCAAINGVTKPNCHLHPMCLHT